MLYRTERFVMWLVTVGLVILVAIQMMMTSEEARDYLRMVESKIHTLVEPEVYQVAVMEVDESVTLKLLNSGLYPEVRVLVNNERAFYFEKSVVKVPVSGGDMLIIDTRGVQEALYFEVVHFSDNISTLEPGQQFRVQNDLKAVPIEIAYYNKI